MHVRVGLLAGIAVAIIFVIPLASAATTVDLGTADSFAILAGTGITNTGHSTVKGDVGSHPTPAQTGFGPGDDSVHITGTNHHDNATTLTAKDALVAAYDDAANRTGGTPVAGGELGGLLLPPGVYVDDGDPDSLAITGTLTLDGLNDPNSIFIFQSGSTLITASGSNVVLTRGAQACNIFWQVGSSATLGTGSHLEGTILALTSITLDNGATVDGRVLARNGAVTMDTNTVQIVPCEEPTPTTTPPPTTSAPSTTTPPTTQPPSTTAPPTTQPPTATSSTTTSPSSTGTPPLTTSAPPPTPPTTGPQIPFFPTGAALAVAAIAGLGGAFLIMRKQVR